MTVGNLLTTVNIGCLIFEVGTLFLTHEEVQGFKAIMTVRVQAWYLGCSRCSIKVQPICRVAPSILSLTDFLFPNQSEDELKFAPRGLYSLVALSLGDYTGCVPVSSL